MGDPQEKKEEKKQELESTISDNENIKNNGEVTLDENFHNHRIYLDRKSVV